MKTEIVFFELNRHKRAIRQYAEITATLPRSSHAYVMAIGKNNEPIWGSSSWRPTCGDGNQLERRSHGCGSIAWQRTHIRTGISYLSKTNERIHA